MWKMYRDFHWSRHLVFIATLQFDVVAKLVMSSVQLSIICILNNVNIIDLEKSVFAIFFSFHNKLLHYMSILPVISTVFGFIGYTLVKSCGKYKIGYGKNRFGYFKYGSCIGRDWISCCCRILI